MPVPALAITCGAAAFLNPAAVAIIAGLAGTIGELTGYFLGYSGSDVVRQGRLYQRIETWMRRRGWLLLFIISAVPNPLFDIAGIAAGVLRYPLWRLPPRRRPGQTSQILYGRLRLPLRANRAERSIRTLAPASGNGAIKPVYYLYI